MADVEVTGTAPEGTPAATVNEELTNVQITLEQICASILNQIGTTEIPVADVLKNYSGKTIQIQHDDEKNVLVFALVDLPATETPAENA
jgi:leucyl aminopeptidase